MKLFEYIKRKINKTQPLLSATSQHSEKEYPTQDLNKLEPPLEGYIKIENVIHKTDGSKITDEDIPTLIRMGQQNSYNYYRDSPNPVFHLTLHEQELEHEFRTKYNTQLEKAYNRFYDLHSNLQHQEALNVLDEIEGFCTKHGEGGTIYFNSTYEWLHNSKNPCFSYREVIKNKIENEAKYKIEYDILYDKILNIIHSHSSNNGILQKDIYKMFPKQKSTAMGVIKNLVNNNIISKEKKGNTFTLKVINIDKIVKD